MTQTSYPFDTLDTTEAQYSQLFRRLQSTGVAGDPTTTDLKVTANSSGMQVSLATGHAIVRGHFYNNDAALTLAIGASSSNPRKDLIVLRLDPTANSITAVVKAGTASATPSDPSLTQTDEGVYELAIARVTIPGNATTISAGDVTDIRKFIGEPFGKWSTSLRPSSPYVGCAGFNTTLALPEYWDGTAWVLFTPTAITASMISAGEQANISAGKLRSGGISSGTAITIHVQSTTPTAASSGDLWFW